MALALQGFRELEVVFGWQLRVLLGHVVNFFQLMPLSLSILDRSYQFVQQNLQVAAALWGDVRGELWILEGLVFLVKVNAAAPWVPVAFCGDASETGYAVHAGHLRREWVGSMLCGL